MKTLVRSLLRALDRLNLAGLKLEPPPVSEAEYDSVIRKARLAARRLQRQYEHNRELIDKRYKNLLDLPEGRKATFLQNTSPAMLHALTYEFIRQSYSKRFVDAGRSLELAKLGVEMADLTMETRYLSTQSAADLKAEALAYLANAKRIASDLQGAEQAFTEAERLVDQGTGDRDLKADLLGLKAALLNSQGRSEEAAGLFDREIALRRLLGDSEKLGNALINRGWIACWTKPTPEACDLLNHGLELVGDNPRTVLLALHALAEGLARDGQALDAWKVMWTAGLTLPLVDEDLLRLRHRWIEGIIYRDVGETEKAETTLRSVRDSFLARGIALQAALVSLDLACISAAEGRFAELRELAAEAYSVFAAERSPRRALAAVVMLQKAAEAEELPARLAVEIANYLVRVQHNRNLRFDGPEE